jgi:putative chitinase
MTPAQLKLILPGVLDPNVWAKALNDAATEFDFASNTRMAAFVAQVGHESMNLNRLRENLSYSIRGLMATWPKRFPTEAAAAPFARNPERLANFVYANRLGNGEFASGDGWRFRGGGCIQLTGRANYREAGAALGEPLEISPQKIQIPSVAARAAGWFWKTHGCNELADAGDFDKITETINGPAMLGAAERRELWQKAKQVLCA